MGTVFVLGRHLDRACYEVEDLSRLNQIRGRDGIMTSYLFVIVKVIVQK